MSIGHWVNGEADHVHGLIDLPPHRAVSECVNALKTNTSRLLRRDFGAELERVYRSPVRSSRSYCVISVGGAPLEVLKAYIQQQDARN
ncbi:MAG: IS200/IS605 family transposase [Proteobacteria bacterium]|nr:IS200/IS605 family transposase [Pseudomonadota bacterium]